MTNEKDIKDARFLTEKDGMAESPDSGTLDDVYISCTLPRDQGWEVRQAKDL